MKHINDAHLKIALSYVHYDGVRKRSLSKETQMKIYIFLVEAEKLSFI